MITKEVHNKSFMYTRKRIPFCEREKAAYLILRRTGLSINQISNAFGRSTSVIHRVLMKAEQRGTRFLSVWGQRFDLRKMKGVEQARSTHFKWFKMLKLLSQWTLWVCGEGERPP